jgi:hypothetical protein
MASIPRQILSSWRHYFKELLKLQPVDINVVTPSHQKKKLLSLLGDLK